MKALASHGVLQGYWLEELHREIGRQESGLRSVLVRDATGHATSLDIFGTGDVKSLAVWATSARGRGWEYTDSHGNRIASADDAAIAVWEIRTRIKR